MLNVPGRVVSFKPGTGTLWLVCAWSAVTMISAGMRLREIEAHLDRPVERDRLAELLTWGLDVILLVKSRR